MPITPISIKGFTGETPAIDSRLIDAHVASDSVNAWLFSGRIEPVHSLTPLHVMVNTAARSWFRVPKDDASAESMTNSWWLEFENENVRVIRSPIVGQDNGGRYYWADGIAPKMLTGDMIRSAGEADRRYCHCRYGWVYRRRRKRRGSK